MILIGTGTADHVDLAAGGTAEFGRQNALDDLDLRNGLNAHHTDLILSSIGSSSPRFRVGNSIGAVYGNCRATLRNTVQPDVAAPGNARRVLRHARCFR